MEASSDRRLRAAVVGTGRMGRNWLRAVRACDAVELVGVADLDLEAARRALGEVAAPSGVTVAETIEVLVDRTEPDFVVNATVPDAHYAITLAALSRGIPVLSEKPMAATMAQGVELVAAAEAYDQLFMVSQNRRYHPELLVFADCIRRLGQLGIIVAMFFKAPHFGGFRDKMYHPFLLDMAVHHLDMARFLTKAAPVTVVCEEYSPPWSWYQGDVAATAMFQMSNGTRYVYTGSWCSAGLETSGNGLWRVSGERGSAYWDGEGPPVLELTQESDTASTKETTTEQTAESPASGINASLHDFVQALRTGATPQGECHDNLWSLAMVHAAIQSSRTGTRVAIADILAQTQTS